jgi:Ca2+/Na+ antiporter
MRVLTGLSQPALSRLTVSAATLSPFGTPKIEGMMRPSLVALATAAVLALVTLSVVTLRSSMPLWEIVILLLACVAVLAAIGRRQAVVRRRARRRRLARLRSTARPQSGGDPASPFQTFAGEQEVDLARVKADVVTIDGELPGVVKQPLASPSVRSAPMTQDK